MLVTLKQYHKHKSIILKNVIVFNTNFEFSQFKLYWALENLSTMS